MKNSPLQTSSFSATDALREAVIALQEARGESPQLDARLLLEHVLGVSRETLLAGDVEMTPSCYAAYTSLIEKRAQRQPVAQLLGRREFWGMNFKVTQATLDPRPDSETIVETLLETYPDRGSALRILDMGTGTGCLLLALLSEYKNARGTGVDISADALEIARENAQALGMKERAEFIESRWGEAIAGRTFDMIVANPPYIPTQVIGTLHPEVCEFEPHVALDGGEDGLDHYRAIMAQLPGLLEKGASAAFEIGEGQENSLREIAEKSGLNVTGMKKDLAGITRCIMVQQQG